MPCKLGITSISLGRSYAGHDFIHKMDMAQLHGFKGIELFHEDLAAIAKDLPGGLTRDNEINAALIIRHICQERDLEVICLQPFWHYEGLLDRAQHDALIDKLHFWFKLARALQVDLIQIPSNFLPSEQLSDDVELAVSDLRKAADLGLAEQPPIRFVYEALAWGTHCDTWQKSWEMVQAVNRPNFGLCLDTFNIAAKVWADPASPTGCVEDADLRLSESLDEMARVVDVEKVFCVQVVDGERLTAPLIEGHEYYDPEQPARMSWSRNCRLFYREKKLGAYLPVDRVVKAIFQDLRFEGWVSLELFNRKMAHQDSGVPAELAARGAASWKKMQDDLRPKTDKASKSTPIGSVSAETTLLRLKEDGTKISHFHPFTGYLTSSLVMVGVAVTLVEVCTKTFQV